MRVKAIFLGETWGVFAFDNFGSLVGESINGHSIPTGQGLVDFLNTRGLTLENRQCLLPELAEKLIGTPSYRSKSARPIARHFQAPISGAYSDLETGLAVVITETTVQDADRLEADIPLIREIYQSEFTPEMAAETLEFI